MAHQAVITLEAISTGIFPQTRTIRVNPDQPSIPVGRASKSVSKGLVGAEDNAWFDSPVMSRDHAELLFDEDNMAIKIQDLSSMHGTTVNDIRLPIKDPRTVQCGDILVFGAEVQRGPDTFPPCIFKIVYEFTPWTRGFQFPDSSDVDDEEDTNEVEASLVGEDNTPAESPVPKYSASIEAIDLTTDKPVENSTSSMNTIDLTRDDPVPVIRDAVVQELEPTMQGELPVDNPMPQKTEEVVTGHAFVDSDSEEDACYEEEYEQQEDIYESEIGSYSEWSDKDDNENDQETDEPGTDEDDIESASDWVHHLSDSKSVAAIAHSDIAASDIVSDSCERQNTSSQRMFYDNKDIPVSNMRTTARDLSEVSGNVEHCYDGSSGVAWETGLSDSVGEEATYAEVSKPVEPNVALGSTFYSQSSSYPCTVQAQEQATERQPSPSDAAMMKSMGQAPMTPQQGAALSTSQTVNPTSVHHIPNSEWNNATLTTVGNQAKQDFFNARKENLATLCSRGQYTETSMWGDRSPVRLNLSMAGHQYNGHQTSLPTQAAGSQSYSFNRLQTSMQDKLREMALLAQRERSAAERILGEHNQQVLAHIAQRRLFSQHRALAAQANAQAIAASQKNFTQTVCSLPQAGAHHTADNINGMPEPSSEESPGIDSTSAFTYNQTTSSKEVGIPPSVDSGEGPETEKALEASTKPLKRKFGELEKQVRDWAETSIHSTGRRNITPEAVDAVDSRAVYETLQSPREAFASLPGQQERSTKRLKRFVEAAGYAALGGLAVGAGLFSILVATAPEFA